MKRRSGVMPPFHSAEVAEVFAAMPTAPRQRLLRVRALIFDTASKTPGVGPIEEALRWGEPSYLTSQSRSGTTVRLGIRPPRADHDVKYRCALYVHCQTHLLEQYRLRHADVFEFEGARAVLFGAQGPFPVQALRDCIRLALTYHVS